jgi:hypothetical protein
MTITINEGSKYYLVKEDLYKQLGNFLSDFENATDDDTDPEWLSDGEWLDVALSVMRSIYINSGSL